MKIYPHGKHSSEEFGENYGLITIRFELEIATGVLIFIVFYDYWVGEVFDFGYKEQIQ